MFEEVLGGGLVGVVDLCHVEDEDVLVLGGGKSERAGTGLGAWRSHQ